MKLTTYYGNTYTNGLHSGFSLILNLQHRIHHFKEIVIETTYIRVPLRKIGEGVSQLFVVNPLTTWLITHDKHVILVDRIEVFGLNNQGERVFEKSFNIDIPLNNINWGYYTPEIIKRVGNTDIGMVSVLKKKEPTRDSLETLF